MKKILRIAQFEFLEKVKTKSFIVFTLLFPLIALGIGIIPGLLINNINSENPAQKYSLLYNDKASNSLHTDNINNDKNIKSALPLYALNEILHNQYVENYSKKSKTTGFPNFQNIQDLSSMYVSSMILIMLLFMLILFSGGMLIRSLVEEKSNRIIEVLLSSCTASELMSGKILGLSILGLFQLFIWVIFAVLLSKIGYIPLDFFSNIGIIIIYFVLGYIFFTAIFVGVGSITNTEQEAQQFTTYLSIVMVLPLILAIKIIQYPNSETVKLLSYFPLTTPPVMILRLRAQELPLWEIGVTILILLVSIYITILISSRIFRIGILAYGKHPSIKELYHWFREG